VPQTDFPPLSQKDLEHYLELIATPEQRDTFHNELELDFAYSVPGLARFRVSVLKQRGTMGFTFRAVLFGIPDR